MAEFWWRDALCAQIGTEFFFGEGSGNKLHEARRACRMCPVREQCLADELCHEEQGQGIFGGFGIAARRTMRRRVERGQDPEWVAKIAIAREGVQQRERIAS